MKDKSGKCVHCGTYIPKDKPFNLKKYRKVVPTPYMDDLRNFGSLEIAQSVFRKVI
jgi:ribosomal protein S26